MGTLECQRCTATAEADTFEEADSLIDHAYGRIISRDCAGDEKDLVWNGEPAFEITSKRVASDPLKSTTVKPKKSKG